MSVPVTSTPQRRLVLQVLMWVIFAATMGGAVLLAQAKSGLWRVDLTDSREFGSVAVRLPRGWAIRHQEDGASDQVQAQEGAVPRRSLRISVTHPDSGGNPMDFLMGSGLFQLMTLDELDVRQVETIEVPNGEGVIIHPRRGPSSFAIMTFHDGRAVTVQMTSRGSNQASDDAILYHVANSIRLKPAREAPVTPPRTGHSI